MVAGSLHFPTRPRQLLRTECGGRGARICYGRGRRTFIPTIRQTGAQSSRNWSIAYRPIPFAWKRHEISIICASDSAIGGGIYSILFR